MFIFTLIIITCFLCWLTALFFYRKEKGGYGLPIVCFLGLTTLVELTGYLVYFVFHQKNNYWVFNAFLPVETWFLAWLLYKIIQPYVRVKPWVWMGIAIFSLIYFYESTGHRFVGMSMNAKKFASIFLIILCLCYYYCLLKKDEYVALKTHPPFWLVTGIFFFYFGSVSCDFFFEYLAAVNSVSIKPVRYVIFIVLNFLLYSCWSYAFICRYRQMIS